MFDYASRHGDKGTSTLQRNSTNTRGPLVNINVYSKTVLYYMWKEIDTK
jgi:hypothetical protein